MIETSQSATAAAEIGACWAYVREIGNWAAIMPGYRECEIIDADNSRWTLQVGVGGLQRTVRVAVHVARWDGPDAAHFTYRVEGDPVGGSGSYRAKAVAPDQTEITLYVQIEGSGPMAAMWEALGKPLLPQFAKSFAEQLAADIAGAKPATTSERPNKSGLGDWLARFWRWLSSRKQGVHS